MVYALFVRTNLEKNNILFSFYKNNKNNPSSKHYLFNSSLLILRKCDAIRREYFLSSDSPFRFIIDFLYLNS